MFFFLLVKDNIGLVNRNVNFPDYNVREEAVKNFNFNPRLS